MKLSENNVLRLVSEKKGNWMYVFNNKRRRKKLSSNLLGSLHYPTSHYSSIHDLVIEDAK